MTTAGDFICLCMKKKPAELAAALPRAESIAKQHGLPLSWVKFYIGWELAR